MKIARYVKLVGGILVVLLLVVVISSLFGPVSHYGLGAQRMDAWLNITSLKTALVAYKSEFGTYPSGDTAAILRALRGDNPKQIIFFYPSPSRIDEHGQLLDPWRTPYEIRIVDSNHFALRSAGQNKQFEDHTPNDDITEDTFKQ